VKANWSINYPGRVCMGVDLLSLSRDGQRLRLDVFKGLEARLRLPSFSAGRSLLAGRPRSHPHDNDDNDDDEWDNRSGR